jgi:hypothetical protein
MFAQKRQLSRTANYKENRPRASPRIRNVQDPYIQKFLSLAFQV